MNLGRLPDALAGVCSGEAAMQRTLVARVLERFHGGEPRWRDPVVGGFPERRLTSREWEGLELLAQGRSTADTAPTPVLSPTPPPPHLPTILPNPPTPPPPPP